MTWVYSILIGLLIIGITIIMSRILIFIGELIAPDDIIEQVSVALRIFLILAASFIVIWAIHEMLV